MGRNELHDLISEGCISLRDAYERVVKALWGDPPPTGDLNHYGSLPSFHPAVTAVCRATLSKIHDQLNSELINVFASEQLDAFVRVPGEKENRCIPARTWHDTYFAERVFLNSRIMIDHGGYWTSLIGRTPFVRRSQFDPWMNDQVARRGDPRARQSPANKAVREHLIGLAMNGVLPSTEVEALASKWKCPPLASRADYVDPMQEPRWTLCMTVAWVAWGDVDAVREVMEEYCANTWYWRSCTRHLPIEGSGESCTVQGEELVCLQPESLTLLRIAEATNSDPREASKRMSIRSAREQLWHVLGEGKFAATGIDGSDQVSVIPAHQWSYLSLAGRRKGADYLVWSEDTTKTAYRDITVQRAPVVECWYGMPGNRAKSPRHQGLSSATFNQVSRLELAIDHPGQAIRFAGGPCLCGNSYKLIARLAEQHEMDVDAKKTQARFAYVNRELLEEHFKIDNERLRKWVERARRDVEKKFRQCIGFVLNEHDVIQSDNWKGYRLNPEVRIIARSELGDG